MVGDKSGEAGGGQMMNGAVSHANQPRIQAMSSVEDGTLDGKLVRIQASSWK